MGQIKRVGDLEIDEDLDFQRSTWKVERIGWTVMGMILLAALAGFLGPGPVSHSVAGVKDSELWAEYNRFVRYRAPSEILVHFQPRKIDGGKIRIRLNRLYTQAVRFNNISPEPAETELTSDAIIYTFNVKQTENATAIVFPVMIEAMGSLKGRVGIVGGSEVEFRQFSFP